MKTAIWWVLLLAVLGAIGVGFYYMQKQEQQHTAAAPTPTAAAAPAAPAEPAEQHPIPAEEPGPSKPLPSLEGSDAEAQESLSGLFGTATFGELLVPKELIRHIVATVDNLPREKVAQRLSPFKPVAGEFKVAGSGGSMEISPANAARYTPYVRLAQSADAGKLVAVYVHYYPLFQQAYADLGYPKGHFNDRLIEVIDNLLTAPDPAITPKMTRPGVFYVYEDPDFESLPIGQKILLRMGKANEDAVKSKLREIREALLSQAPN
jgi:DUF3014 family protein